MRDVAALLPGMFDEPFADSSAIPTYLVSRAARAHVTVALSGDGGDELFFGYPRYRLSRKRRMGAWSAAASCDWVPRVRRRAFRPGGCGESPMCSRSDEADRYARFITLVDACGDRDHDRYAAGDRAPHTKTCLSRAGRIDWRERPGLLDLVSYLPEDILTKVDRASMAVGLEVRAPLLDHRVVEYALGSAAVREVAQGDDEVAAAPAAVQASAALHSSIARRWVSASLWPTGSAVRFVNRWMTTAGDPIWRTSASILSGTAKSGRSSRQVARLASICSGRRSFWSRGPGRFVRLRHLLPYRDARPFAATDRGAALSILPFQGRSRSPR